MLPGALGADDSLGGAPVARSFPNTIRAAARTLPTLCPYCNRELGQIRAAYCRDPVQPLLGHRQRGGREDRLLMAAIATARSRGRPSGGRMVNAVTAEAQTYSWMRARLTAVHSVTPRRSRRSLTPFREGVPLIPGTRAGEATRAPARWMRAGEALPRGTRPQTRAYLDNANVPFSPDRMAWPPARSRKLDSRGLAASTVVVTWRNRKGELRASDRSDRGADERSPAANASGVAQ